MMFPYLINFPDETCGLFFMQIFNDIHVHFNYVTEYILNAYQSGTYVSTGPLDSPSIKECEKRCKENIIRDLHVDDGEGKPMYDFIVTAISDDMLDSIVEDTGCTAFNAVPSSNNPFQISEYVNLIVDRVCYHLSNKSPLGPDIPFDIKGIGEKWKSRQMIIGYISKIEAMKNGNTTNPKIQTLFYDLSKFDYCRGEKITIKNIMDWMGVSEV